MREMKDRSIVCNIGHFDSEIQVEALKIINGVMSNPKLMKLNFQMVRRIILLAEEDL